MLKPRDPVHSLFLSPHNRILPFNKSLIVPQVDASIEARAQSITVFAVGVGNEITNSELISIANKPSSTYVLYAEDYTTIDRIRDSMEQKLCEGTSRFAFFFVTTKFLLLSNRIIIFILESVCPTRIPVASRDEKGFELMVGMNIEKKGKKINGSLVSETAFALTTSTDITEDTRYHPVERV